MTWTFLYPLAAVGLLVMTVSPLHAQKLAENLGRVHTITVEARNASGNTTIQTVVVSVPKNRSTK